MNRYFRISLRWLLALAFGSLVAAAVGAVLAISVAANFANTYSLLSERTTEFINGLERRIRAETEQAERAVTAIATQFPQDGSLADLDALQALIPALLRTAPVMEALMIFDEGGNGAGYVRLGDGSVVPAPASLASPKAAEALRALRDSISPGGLWGNPVQIAGERYHYLSMPLEGNGRVTGHVVGLIGQAVMNRMMRELEKGSTTTVFVLTGNNEVIGHSKRPADFTIGDAIAIEKFPDTVLQELPAASPSTEFDVSANPGIKVLESGTYRKGHIFIMKDLPGYSARPYKLGAYFSKVDVGAEIRRAFLSMLAGLAGLTAAVWAAILLGKRISRPMSRIADTAGKFTGFRIEEIEPLPRSRIAEIDDQSHALNKLRIAMLEFSRYVPRELVASLVRNGPTAGEPVEREVTIMFTDIVGFTTLSEHMNATETAELLNRHFAIICEAVESTHGTIDKFMGDGVMAFWGAPLDDAHHVGNALHAAREIARRLDQENRKRVEEGRLPINIRIGLHTGKVVVGNIGGEHRRNYTMVGDTVNVTQRLEQLARDLSQPGGEITIAVSGTVVTLSGNADGFTPAGTRIVPGRRRPVQVFLLKTDDLSNKDNIVRFPDLTSS